MFKWIGYACLAIIFLMFADTAQAQKKKFKRKAPSSYADSATFPGYDYYKAGGFKRWLLGDNYRDEWTQPVTVPVFEITKEKGGLEIDKMGGGMQTKSLRLEDKDGNEYVLRSIEKFPDNNIPPEFRKTFVKDVLVDGISASYPYAALSIPIMLDALKIPHAKPRLVYVPDDPALGEFRHIFANTLSMFEEREPGGFDKNIGTDDVLEKMLEDNDHRIQQQAVLKARIFDMFIMDFDRHEDQWRWGTDDEGEHKTYYPIPRDRDQAFFINNGFIPKRVKSYFPKFQGFKAKADNINTFNFNGIDFDRTFLNATTKDDWRKKTDTVLQQMTDSVIELALAQQPKEIHGYAMPDIVATLKERRKYLMDEMMEYYHFLAKQVLVAGSDKDEFFDVNVLPDKNVNVTVFNLDSENKPTRVIYNRLFYQDETKEVVLYGLGKKDSFVVRGNHITPIRIRIVGGRGNDYYDLQSEKNKRRIFIYDSLGEKSTTIGHGFRNRMSNADTVHKYDRSDFKYNKFNPGLSLAFNRDEGVFIGVGFKHRTHSFRKVPYQMNQTFFIRYAAATRALTSDYELELIDVMGGTDLLVNASMNLPRNTINFFGFGNETIFDDVNKGSIDFFRTRLKNVDFNTLLRFSRGPTFNASIGPHFSYYHLERDKNEGRITYYPSFAGLDSANVYERKTYLGPLVQLDFDKRKGGTMLPSNGYRWQARLLYQKGLNDFSFDYGQYNTDFSFYKTILPDNRLVLAVRVGGGINTGNFEFYQAQFLSGTDNLRGYRKYRFAGDKMVFNNVELRLKLTEFQTYLFPGTLGLQLFHDVGRVWMDDEKSNTWYNGYGLGLWLAPANAFVATASISHSREGWLPFVGLGFRF